MNLQGRDKRAVMLGTGLALFVLIVGYVLIPMGRTWASNQDRLTSRQEQIATLKGRAKSQESLVIRRNALVTRLGSIFGAGEAAGGSNPTNETEPAPPNLASHKSGSLAGYIEQTAEKAGIKIGRITPRRMSSGRKSGKHFRPVTLQVKVEANPVSFITMLAALEGGDYLVVINSLQLRRNITKGDSINATFEVVGYEAVEKTS